jgi:dihydroorotase
VGEAFLVLGFAAMRDISRRDLLSAGAAVLGGARLLAGQAARYDLVIRGGRVIDPVVKLDAVRDVAIVRGKIAAVAANLEPGAAAVIDARGKLGVPGLIDIHTHAARSAAGPPLLLKDGVTGWVDAGSQGADRIADVIDVARSSPQTGRVLINIGRAGITTAGDTKDLALADVAAARQAIAAHKDFVVGIKARLSSDVTGPNDYEVLKRAQEAAAPSGVPVMIHMGQTASSLSKLLPILKRGDIVTHMFAPPPNGILDDRNRLLREVLEARRRGVWFDVGNGRLGHVRWDVVAAVMEQRFWPDAISTDWNTMSRTTGVVDICNCMSKFLGYGMSVADVVACNTANAAKMFPAFADRGTLAVGGPADVAVLELRDGNFEFLDNFDNKIAGRQRLFAAATVVNGIRVG